MKILLTNSPGYIKDMDRHFSYGRFGCTIPIPYSLGGKDKHDKIREHYNAYPWSLGYASAILKKETKEVIKTIDAQAEDYNEEDFKGAVYEFGPDLMIVELPTISFSLCMDILKELKERITFILILTGLHVSGLAEEVLREYGFVDYIIKGDYGLPLLRFIEENGNIAKVPNLYYRRKDKIEKAQAKMEFIDFDSLPYPDREDLQIGRYHDFEIAGKPTVHMVTSRGCPFRCFYCNSIIFWPRGFYWKRSVNNIVDEMVYVKEKYKARQIYFDDDIMTFDRQRMIDFANEVLKRKLRIPWTFMGDINIDEDIMSLLVKAGAIGLKFGIESINTKTLDYIGKPWVSEYKITKFVKMCKKYRLYTHGDFIIGLPYEDRESLDRMLKFLIDLNLDSIQVYSAQPLPGTPFYYKAKEEGWLIAKEWIEYDGNYRSPVSYPWLKKEEIELTLKKIQKEWGLRVFKNYLKSPWKIWNYLKVKGFYYTLKKSIFLLMRFYRNEELFISGM